MRVIFFQKCPGNPSEWIDVNSTKHPKILKAFFIRYTPRTPSLITPIILKPLKKKDKHVLHSAWILIRLTSKTHKPNSG